MKAKKENKLGSTTDGEGNDFNGKIIAEAEKYLNFECRYLSNV